MKKDFDSIYINRAVLNKDELYSWAKSVGFKTAVPDFHFTLAYSEVGIKNYEPLDSIDVIPGLHMKSIEPLGDEGAVVIKFDSPLLHKRWEELCELGANWKYESYIPHMTITYSKPEELDISKIELPSHINLILGGENHEELDGDKSYTNNEITL